MSWPDPTCNFSVLTSSSWWVEEEEEEEADKSHSLFHHADFILHSPFDETGEQTWVESGDLRPTELRRPLKPSILLMNSRCNHAERSAVCTELIDPVPSVGTCKLSSDPVT